MWSLQKPGKLLKVAGQNNGAEENCVLVRARLIGYWFVLNF